MQILWQPSEGRRKVASAGRSLWKGTPPVPLPAKGSRGCVSQHYSWGDGGGSYTSVIRIQALVHTPACVGRVGIRHAHAYPPYLIYP
eukprot:1184829-Prorocentrum_minimum.AAC.4